MVELTLHQVDAVVALLRVAADGEMTSEQMRCQLGECEEFNPLKVFQVLQGAWKNYRGHLSSYSVLRWLQSQPHILSSAKVDDVSAMLAPYEDGLDELRYEGFLKIVLPKDPTHQGLKDAILARVARASWSYETDEDQVHIPPDVAYRLCSLFKSEIDVSRHLKFHRKRLMELGVMLQSICKFLDKEQGVCAGMGGLLSPMSFRAILINDLKAMTSAQCDALLHRINPSQACLARFHELGKVLGFGPASLTTSSLTPKSDLKDALGTRFDTAIFGKSGDDGFGLSASRTVPQATPVASIGVDTNGDGLVDTYITGADRNGDGIPDVLQQHDISWLPTPTRLLYDEDLRTDHRSRSLDAWSSSPVTPRRYTQTIDLPLVARSIDFDNLLPKATSGYDKWLSSPIGHSPGLASTQASTADFLSPRSLRSWASPSPRKQYGLTAPLKDPGQTRSASVPVALNRSSSRISAPILNQRGSVATILKVIALQGQLDAQMEDSKSLFSPCRPLPCIWDAINRYKTTDGIDGADLWSFCQAFGGPSFGSLRALLHEVKLRRPRGYSVNNEKWSFRDLASFILNVDTPEYDAITNARSDEDALSIEYIMRNSDPCPGCGVRVQRDADAAGCPTVTCTVCRTPFKCHIVLSDYSRPAFPLSVAGQYQLYRMMSQAASLAYELEQARDKLSLFLDGDALCTLSAVFTLISDGRLSISIDDLHRTFLNYNIDISMKELFLLKQRYGKATSQVSFAEFVRQLSPRSSPLCV